MNYRYGFYQFFPFPFFSRMRFLCPSLIFSFLTFPVFRLPESLSYTLLSRRLEGQGSSLTFGWSWSCEESLVLLRRLVHSLDTLVGRRLAGIRLSSVPPLSLYFHLAEKIRRSGTGAGESEEKDLPGSRAGKELRIPTTPPRLHTTHIHTHT